MKLAIPKRLTPHLNRPLGFLLGLSPFLIPLSSMGQCLPPPSDLIAWWKGEGNWNDETGNHTLPLNSNSYTPGKVGQAIQWTGLESISFPLQSAGNTTWETWVKPSSLTGSQIILSEDDGSQTFRELSLENGEFAITVSPGFKQTFSPAALDDWQHVAVVFQAPGIFVYLNGSLVLGAFASVSTGSNLAIGSNLNPLSTARFQGALDEISIYNRALSSDEIAAIYTADSEGKCAAAPPPPPGTTFLASADTMITENLNFGGPSSLHGSDTDLFAIGSIAYRSHPMVAFDLSSLAGTTASGPAQFEFWLKDGFANGQARSLTVHEILIPWDESSTSFSSFGGALDLPPQRIGSALSENIVTFSGPDTGYRSWSIPETLIQKWLDNPSSNHGLIVLNNRTDYSQDLIFESREGSHPPQLTLTTTGCVLPIITQHPTSLSVCHDGSAEFFVTASSGTPLSFQWFKDGDILPETSSTLTLPSVTEANAGEYHVVVSNDCGSTTSQTATLTIDALTLLSLNKPVTGSGYIDEFREVFPFDNLTDGRLNDTGSDYDWSFWLTPDASPHWATIDLEDTYSIEQIRVQNTHNRGSNDRSTQGFSIETSVDGINYTTILAGTLQAVWFQNPIPFESFTFPPTQARYVKFNVLSVYGASGGLNEIEVYGQTCHVVECQPPSFVLHPESQIVCPETPVSLSATYLGSEPLSFQWLKNGEEIPGATNPTLDYSSFQASDVGSYSVRITNDCGMLESLAADLSLNQESPVLTLSGSVALTLEACRAPYLEAGAIASDVCDGPLPVSILGSVNTSLPGDYILVYTATNSRGLSSSITRYITVHDTTPPDFTCPAPLELSVGASCLVALPDLTQGLSVEDCSQPVSLSQSIPAGTLLGLGSHEILLTAIDAAQNPATCSVMVHVIDNTPPTLSCPAPLVLQADASGTVPMPDLLSQIVIEDNCPGTLTSTQSVPAGTELEPGIYDIEIQAQDASGNPGSCLVTLQVLPKENEAPVVTLEQPYSGYLSPINQPITFSGTFTDDGEEGTHSAEWILSGANLSPISIPGTVSGFSVTDTIQFPQPGIYSIEFVVTDSEGAFGSTTRVLNDLPAYVVIYDPNGGFVTGGGWIWSPAGAYRPGQSEFESLEGKANFGFVSKYKKGATTPTGQTQFTFKLGNLQFESESYQWLVVAGARAQFKGTGTIHQAGQFGFLLTAIDGQINGQGNDRFRIKIWDQSTEEIIYDNQPASEDNSGLDDTALLRGGQIVIHK